MLLAIWSARSYLTIQVFANLGLSKVGSKLYSKARLDADLDHLDTFYIKDGWSRDGPEGVVQLDYYSSSFAIQFAQLVYSKLAATEDPERSKRYRDRATRFAQDFVHYFDVEGRAIPFGRSNTYRFAQSSFWGALAFADVDLPAPLTWGIVKGLQLKNVRYWAKQASAYSPDGLATIGYNYPNLNMTDYVRLHTASRSLSLTLGKVQFSGVALLVLQVIRYPFPPSYTPILGIARRALSNRSIEAI